MKQLKTKTKLIARFLFVAIIGLSVLSGCKAYDKDIDGLNADLTELRADLVALGTQVQANLDAKVAELNGKIEVLTNRIVTLENNSATKAELDAVKQDLVNNYVTKASLEAYQATVETRFTALTTRIATLEANSATKAELDAVDTELRNLIGQTNAALEALGAEVTTLRADLTTLETEHAALIAALDLRISALEVLPAAVAALEEKFGILETKVEANETAIANLKADLEALQAEVLTLTGRVDVLETDLADLKADFDQLRDEFDALVETLEIRFQWLTRRLTSLVSITDFGVNGYDAFDFSVLESACDPIVPEVVISYHANPSSITEADIDTENIEFIVKKVTHKFTGNAAPSAEERITAEYVSLENGILKIKVKVEDFAAIFGDNTILSSTNDVEKFNKVALSVPLSAAALADAGDTVDVDEAVVVSDYVRLYNSIITGIELARDNADLDLLPVTDADAKALLVNGVDGHATASDPQVVTLPLGGTLNLVDEVTLVHNGVEFDTNDYYKLRYKFDLLDENGDEITYVRNTVEQQDLLVLSDADAGTITAAEVDEATVALSDGRTPIVRVWVYNVKQPECKVVLGFVKIHLVDKQADELDDIVLDKGESDIDCTPYEFKYDIKDIYEAIEITYNDETTATISAADWATHYTLVGGADNHDNKGKVTEVADEIVWNLTLTDILQAYNADGADGEVTITKTVTYDSSVPTLFPDQVVEFTHTFKIPSTPNIVQANLIKEYWYDLNGTNNGTVFEEVKHNIAVPTVGDNDPINAVFATDLGQAFLQDASKKVIAAPASYEFVFLPTQPTLTLQDGTTIVLVVSADGKELLNPADATDVVATINPRNTTDGEVLELNESSDLGKELLNVGRENLRATIGMNYILCPGSTVTLPVNINGEKSFDVVFVRPINAAGESPEDFVDAVSYGEEGSYIDIAEMVSLKDWREYDFETTTSNDLYTYYDVSVISIDPTTIETDLNQAAGVRVNLSTTFPSLQVKTEPTMAGLTPAHGFLTYKNNGTVIGSAFHLYVPVTIEYKWGEIVSTEVVVTVQKTIGGAGVIRPRN